MSKLIVFILALSATISYASNGGGSSIGPGNPASLNCLALNGQLETVTSPEGESANCVVEEWSLYHAMIERGLVKPTRGSAVAMPNPASVNCYDIGGVVRVLTMPNGQVGYCVVEEWSLFRVIDVISDK